MGICSSKSNNDVIFNRSFPIPTHNYAFAAAVLLKTISTNAETIKQWAIQDLGATSHSLTINAPATNICTATIPLVARLLNGERVQSTHTCTLDLPKLPAAARNAHIIPGLASHSLLSVVTMCNAGCTVTLTKIRCSIVYPGRTIVCGHKCMQTGLWMILLQQAHTRYPLSSYKGNTPLHSTPLHSTPLNSTPLRTSHKLSSHTCNGCRCQGHILCRQVCLLHPSTPVLPANIYPNLSACWKHRTLHNPWPDSCIHQQQPTLLHCNQQGSHAQTPI